MSAANPNPMEKSMVSVLVVANAGGGGSPLLCGVTHLGSGKGGTDTVVFLWSFFVRVCTAALSATVSSLDAW
jgi:hypothetical protein